MLRKHFDRGALETEMASSVAPIDDSMISSFSFDYLIMISNLESVLSESDVGSHGIKNGLVSTGDRYFYPIQARSEVVDSFQQVVEVELSKLKELTESQTYHVKHNLSKGEHEALRKLKVRTDITIRQVDKGGAVVILNTEDYNSEALRLLNDISTYRPLDSDPADGIQRGLLQLLDDGGEMGVLEQKIIDFIFTDKPVTPIFHHLQKVHKQQYPVQGRPIVARIGSPLYRLSEWVDEHLQPLFKCLPGYLRVYRTFIGTYT